MSEKLHGFYEDMPNETYHASEGVSKSGLDLMDRSPAHYKNPKLRKSTRNMEIGTAIHAGILEPERFDKEYVIVDSDPIKQGKTWRGIPIYNPSILEGLDWTSTKLLISSYSGQESIVEAAGNLKVPSSNIICFYETVRRY